MRLLSTLLSLIFAALLVVFVTHNTQTVSLNFWPLAIEISMPQALMALIFFALGTLFGGFMTLPRLWRGTWEKHKLTKEIARLNKTNDQDSGKDPL